MKIQFIKRSGEAVTPTRAYPTDIGFDLTAIGLEKVYDNGVMLYDTKIAVKEVVDPLVKYLKTE